MAQTLVNPNTGLIDADVDASVWTPIFAVLRRHRAWFDEAFAKEKAWWQGVDPSVSLMVEFAAYQPDPTRYRFGDEVENDAWIDLEGGNRGCVV